MMKAVPSAIILFLLFLALPLPLLADPYSDIDKTVKVGIFPFEPMNFIDEDGRAAGLYPDLLREMSREEPWGFVFVPGSWAEGLERLQTEEIDLMISVAYSEERDEILDFNTVSVIELWSQVFTRPEEQSININDLAGQRVAIMAKDINGQHYIDTAAELGIESIIVEYPTHSDVFEAVRKGEVLAGVAPQHFGLRHAEQYDLIPSSILFSPFSIYFAAKEGKMADVLRHIDYHLIEWKEQKDSFYYRTLNFWMTGKELRLVVIPPWLIAALAVLFIMAVLFFLFVIVLRHQVNLRTGELIIQKRQYESLVKYASTIILRLNSSGEVITVNRYGEEFFSLKQGQLKGRNPVGTIFSEECGLSERLKKNSDNFVDRLILQEGRDSFIQWNLKYIRDDSLNLKETLCIGTDITERLDIEKNLKETNEQLEEMVYIASHDLQVPLVSMNGYAGELLENYGDRFDEEGLFCLERLQVNSMRMQKLVHSLLDLSRLNTEKKNISRFSLNELIGKIENDMAILLEQEKVKIHCGSLPVISADRARIEGVFRNLILNAVMYEGKNVDISALENRVLIKDDGLGIPSSQLEKIFKPGERLKMNNSEGVGMGLTFSKKVIAQHGGTISADSAGEGRGSTFTIEFPAAVLSGDDHD
ncbi:ATP-binding protein [Spirochaeta isovalerica]|uniref:histidine kinase n=1 Tax=Spirochaeta isovalerica TaxID=150 RepID=A0A841RH89_9SPIO|nr:transporter substrate-binding domain-containing protein [Spirochaeta isovalerica]MBB6482149.1 PAS domain S-box-containing protein [Spirochaeta isovalerica]